MRLQTTLWGAKEGKGIGSKKGSKKERETQTQRKREIEVVLIIYIDTSPIACSAHAAIKNLGFLSTLRFT